jgi:tripartite-type tricarboxylate transporter receptor subunit TctC
MKLRNKLARWVLALCAAISAGLPSVQAAPSNLSLIVSASPGTGLDILARTLSQQFGVKGNYTTVVENKAGASGNIAASFVAKSAPDGHNLLVGYSMFHVGNPSMYPNLSWDPLRDFTPIGMLVVSPHVMAVHPSVSAKTLREFVDLARANPGKLNYAT